MTIIIICNLILWAVLISMVGMLSLKALLITMALITIYGVVSMTVAFYADVYEIINKENYSVANSFKNIVSTKKFGREAAKKHIERINGRRSE